MSKLKKRLIISVISLFVLLGMIGSCVDNSKLKEPISPTSISTPELTVTIETTPTPDLTTTLDISQTPTPEISKAIIPITTPKISPKVSPKSVVKPTVAIHRYIGSKNKKVYHELYCNFAQNIHKENKVYFSSIADAQSHGYRPCKTCHP